MTGQRASRRTRPTDATGERGVCSRDRQAYAGRAADAHDRAAATAPTFKSVICAVAGGPADEAARHQAATLASPGGTVEVVSAAQLTRHALTGGRDRYDLIVVGSGAAAFAAVEASCIPILIARRCPLGIEVTDTIVVPIDDSPESHGALELAGLLADAHGGTVTLLVAPRSDPGLQRAITASVGDVRRATGVAPLVIGEPRPPELVIPSAAASLRASLVVLDSGPNPTERRMAARMVGAIGCSALVVPRS
jgi:hypothetical protein